VQNILTRVTGNDPSKIMGRLGVLGNANLFLLNPNGIIFGANSSLDVTGSFTASTASAIQLGNSGRFSATDPGSSTLLNVQPDTLFLNALANQTATITNRGNLSAGQNLTLAAGNLDLQGQLKAGQDLILQAADTLKIRDTTSSPFIAQAGRNLLAQGDRSVDIFALNHPDSGFFAGNNLVLRSANAVIGDAHYAAGGNFQVERLDGSLGSLISPHDPVMRVAGDVTMASYTGASLHIFAGGSVTINGDIEITGADATNGIVETVSLSDGSRIVINGRTEPVLDIRAGTTASGGAELTANITLGDIYNLSGFATGLGKILLTNRYSPNAVTAGSIKTGLISTYGDVAIDSRQNATTGLIDTTIDNLNGGNITLLASRNLTAGELRSRVTAGTGVAGDIILRAGGDIRTSNVTAISQTAPTSGAFSTIKMESTDGSIFLDSVRVIATNRGVDEAPPVGYAANIFIKAAQNVQITNSTIENQGIVGRIFIGKSSASDQNPAGGRVDITSSNLTVTNSGTSAGGVIQITTPGNVAFPGGKIDITNSNLVANSSNTASGGSVSLTSGTSGTINLKDSTINANISGTGSEGKGVEVRAPSGSVSLNNSKITTTTTGTATRASAGDVIVNTTCGNGNTCAGIITNQGTLSLGNASLIDASTASPAPPPTVTGLADGGNVMVYTGNLSILSGSRLRTTTSSAGNAGNVTLNFSGTAEISGISPPTASTITGIQASSTSGVLASSDATSTGWGGNITINPGGRSGNLTLSDGGFLSASTASPRPGGNIVINVNSLDVLSGGQVFTTSAGRQTPPGVIPASVSDAGNITINATGKVQIAGRSFLTYPIADLNNPNLSSTSGLFSKVFGGNARGGNISVTSQNGTIQIGQANVPKTAEIDTSNLGQGTGGNFLVQTVGATPINIANATINAAANGGSKGGDIQLQTALGAVNITGSDLSTSNIGQGTGGNFLLQTGGTAPINIANATITATADGASKGGDIQLQTDLGAVNITGSNLSASNGSLDRQGRSGKILIQTSGADVSIAGNSQVISSTKAGTSGSISLLDVGALQVLNSQVSASTETGTAGNVTVNASRSVNLSGIFLSPDERLFISVAGLLARATQGGTAGEIKIITPSLSVTNGAQATVQNANGKGGFLFVNAGAGSVNLSGGGGLFASATGNGSGGDMTIFAGGLTITDRSQVAVSSQGTGRAGNLTISASAVKLDRNGTISAETDRGSEGNIRLQNLQTLQVLGGSQISASTFNGQKGGTLLVNASRSIEVKSGSSLLAQATGKGNAGDLTLITKDLTIDGGRVAVSSLGAGQGGNLTIVANSAQITNGGKLTADTNTNPDVGGSITIGLTGDLNLKSLGQISTSTSSGKAGAIIIVTNFLGIDGDTNNPKTPFQNRSGIFSSAITGSAGAITILTDRYVANNGGAIVATSFGKQGGNISIKANKVFLFGSSPIVTSIFSEKGTAGTIEIRGKGQRAAFFALQDSDILSTAIFGEGGKITIDFPRELGYIFLAENLSLLQPVTDPSTLRGNNRVDISGSNRFGASGKVTVPDLTFLISALNPLANNFVSADRIVAGSCVARRNVEQGSFTVTGLGGLPRTPFDVIGGRYDVARVRSLSGNPAQAQQPEEGNRAAAGQPSLTATATGETTSGNTGTRIATWKPGDPIQEAQGMVTLPDGRVVLGTIGQIAAIARADNLICHPATTEATFNH
jgi:filamentous hemagglutinin family protein